MNFLQGLTKALYSVAFFACAASVPARALERWSYCVVDSGDKKYVSNVFRQDFGQGYSGDPEVYGRLVNRFVDSVRTGYNLKQTSGAWCYRPAEDIDKGTVAAEREYLIKKSKSVLVSWP